MTRIAGIQYYYPAEGARLDARDGRAVIVYDGIPVPLEVSDFDQLDGEAPDYDMVGRGIYYALRNNPDCAHNTLYATWLRDAYPHHLAELASLIVMLDRKDVDVSYIDRKICYLKIMSLLEPDSPRIPAEIGSCYLDRGLTMSALHQSTVMLYRAETFLSRAYEMQPADTTVISRLGEVSYLLGRYDRAVQLWEYLLPGMHKADEADHLGKRLKAIRDGKIPKIPPVDYLEAIGVAFACYESGDYEECAAILGDIFDDLVFCEIFPLPEVWFHLGECYRNLSLKEYARECYVAALKRDPGYCDAESALNALDAEGGH